MSVSGSLGLLAAVLFGVASANIKLRVDPLEGNSFALYGVPDLGRMDHEVFWGITKPGEMAPVEVNINSSFVLRSTDMKFRAMVVADLNPDPATKVTYPWKLCFFNNMLDAVIEMKHSRSGFVWIMEGTHLCQVTAHSHNFELRNREKVPIANIQIRDPKDDLYM